MAHATVSKLRSVPLATKMKLLRPFINGRYVAGATASGAPEKILMNPTSATPRSTQYHDTTSDEIQHALACAKKSQLAWASESPSHRASILRKAADIMSNNVDLLGEMETSDTGRPIRETKYDVEEGVETLNYYAGVANSIGGNAYRVPGGSAGTNLAYTMREPLGVTVGIG